ncbi:MAG: hypothetical protein ACLT98_15890 [Eggerthellaceae bacterium]
MVGIVMKCHVGAGGEGSAWQPAQTAACLFCVSLEAALPPLESKAAATAFDGAAGSAGCLVRTAGVKMKQAA